jgi:hypothetical protein
MKIGVFGDSFASGEYGPLGWASVLQTYHQYNIHNFGVSSTSLFWSYQQLIENIDNFDVIIFVATSHGRLYWPDTSCKLHHISSPGTIQHAIKTNPPIHELAIFKAAEQYYLNLCNDEFDTFVHSQILTQIGKLCKKRAKKLILIPAFDINIRYQSVFQCSLIAVTFKELATQFGPNAAWRNEKHFTGGRANHMSAANNIVLAGIVNKLLRNTVCSVGLDDFVYKQVSNPELHWDI